MRIIKVDSASEAKLTNRRGSLKFKIICNWASKASPTRVFVLTGLTFELIFELSIAVVLLAYLNLGV